MRISLFQLITVDLEDVNGRLTEGWKRVVDGSLGYLTGVDSSIGLNLNSA